MKKFNISLIIPSHTKYENVYNFINYLNKAELKFNNIYVISDKIDKIYNAEYTLNSYHFKNLVKSLNNVIHIDKPTHGGKIGVVNYVNDLPFDSDENVIIMEDDLMAMEEFFYQCEKFFSTICSDSTPIFVGYTKPNLVEERFFLTFNLLYMWGFAMKFGELKKVINYHNTVRTYDTFKKENIMNDVLNFEYPSPIFEKYKSEFINKIKGDFMANSDQSVDLYFWFYFLQNRLQIVKPTMPYVISFKPSTYKEFLPNFVEMDIKNVLCSYSSGNTTSVPVG